jgi:uncharacterized protein YggE
MFSNRAMAAGADSSTRVVPGETEVTVSVNVRFLLK